MSSYSTVPVVQGGPAKGGLASTAKVYAGRWALSAREFPVEGHRRVDSSMLARGVSCIYMPQSPEAQKKCKSMADLGACAGNSRRCAAVQHAGRARSKQV